MRDRSKRAEEYAVKMLRTSLVESLETTEGLRWSDVCHILPSAHLSLSPTSYPESSPSAGEQSVCVCVRDDFLTAALCV